MRKIILMLICLTGVYTPSHAGEWSNVFFDANQKYAEGRYVEARALYESLLSRGVRSQNLCYNLGNTYYKLGQKGRAILNYERAKKIGAFDEDIMANASFVGSMLEVRQPDEDLSIVQRAGRALRDVLPPSGWFIVTWIFYLGSIASIMMIILRRASSGSAGVIAMTLAILTAFSFVIFRAGAEFHQNYHEGVVVAPKAPVRYSPSFDGSVAFELSEGLKAEIIHRRGDWTQIRLGPKKSGWVQTLTLEEI